MSHSFPDLAGKKVVVTGACGVIGRWIVQAFAQDFQLVLFVVVALVQGGRVGIGGDQISTRGRRRAWCRAVPRRRRIGRAAGHQ